MRSAIIICSEASGEQMQRSDEFRTPDKAFVQGLEVLRHFHVQLGMLGDSETIGLLGSVGPEVFTNRDARELLSVKRQASWKRLARLSEAGLIQKRGHSYRIAPFTRVFVAALSSTLGALVTGAPVRQPSPVSREALESAIEGLEALYAKGKLNQEEFTRRRAALQELVSGGLP